MKDTFKVSYTKVNKYLTCPYAYYLVYERKLKPRSVSTALIFGADMHTLLQHRGEPKEKIKVVIDELSIVYNNQPEEVKSTLGENYIDDLKEIFSDYLKVWKKEAVPDFTEYEFNIDLGETSDGRKIVFNGFIDGLYLDKEKDSSKTIIEEHKTFSVKPDNSTLLMSIQKHLYAKAMEELTGYFPQGILWDYIKSSPAKEPAMLKSGKFSTAKTTSVTPYSWKRACKKAGITDKAYIKEGANSYKENISNFYFRVYEPYNPSMVNKIFEEFKNTVFEIVENEGKLKRKHCSRNCSWCDMLPICKSEFLGEDSEKVIDELYINKRSTDNGRF